MVAALANSTPMRIVVGLAMRDRAGADALVRSQFVPGGAAFHQWLTPAQFTSMFNPTNAQADSVATYLRQQGFTNVTVDLPNKRVEGTWSGEDQEVVLPEEVVTVWRWEA